MNAFYYIDKTSHQQHGPFNPENLKGKIESDTLVWKAGMADWTEARNVDELSFLFEANTPQNNGNRPFTNQPTSMPQGGLYSPLNGNQVEVRPKPESWLVLSILATLLCCMPFGIVGIINASKVDQLYYSGDYDAAIRAASNAKKWSIAAAISFLAVIIFYVLFFMVVDNL